MIRLEKFIEHTSDVSRTAKHMDLGGRNSPLALVMRFVLRLHCNYFLFFVLVKNIYRVKFESSREEHQLDTIKACTFSNFYRYFSNDTTFHNKLVYISSYLTPTCYF